MRIEHIIFLIHPCCYENIDADAIRRDNLCLFVKSEKKVKRRWLQALADRPTNTLFVQLGGPEDLRAAAVANLGDAAVFYPRTPFPESFPKIGTCVNTIVVSRPISVIMSRRTGCS